MKLLTLIRHAKSSWENPNWDDIERPLKKRGINDAKLMANILLEKEISPDIIVCSPAKRAQLTCNIFMAEMNLHSGIKEIHDSIYFQGVKPVIDTFRNIDDKFEHVFLFGHQPYVAAINAFICSEGPHHVPTTGICHISLAIKSWNEIGAGKGKSQFIIFPKMFK